MSDTRRGIRRDTVVLRTGGERDGKETPPVRTWGLRGSRIAFSAARISAASAKRSAGFLARPRSITAANAGETGSNASSFTFGTGAVTCIIIVSRPLAGSKYGSCPTAHS